MEIRKKCTKVTYYGNFAMEKHIICLETGELDEVDKFVKAYEAEHGMRLIRLIVMHEYMDVKADGKVKHNYLADTCTELEFLKEVRTEDV